MSINEAKEAAFSTTHPPPPTYIFHSTTSNYYFSGKIFSLFFALFIFLHITIKC